MTRLRRCPQCNSPHVKPPAGTHACRTPVPDTPKPVEAFAALDASGQIIINSVRETAEGVRLSAGECTPVRVFIVLGDAVASALALSSEKPSG